MSILPELETDDVQTDTGFVSFVSISLIDDMITHIIPSHVYWIYIVISGVSFKQRPKDYSEKYRERINRSTKFKWSSLHALAFDAVWTLALVLNCTEEMRLNLTKEQAIHENCSTNLTGNLVPLNKFNYSNAFMGCVMKHNFYKVTFTGVSVSFAKYCIGTHNIM